MSNFKVIKSTKQYHEYVTAHMNLWKKPTQENEDDRELLELLIEKWESETLKREEDDSDPIEFLQWLMENHNLSAIQLSKDLEITKGTMSKILNRKKGLSKHVIRKLAERFKMTQEAFNREYPLQTDKKKSSLGTTTTSANKIVSSTRSDKKRKAKKKVVAKVKARVKRSVGKLAKS